MITVLLLTFESSFGIQKVYMSQDFYYSIQNIVDIIEEYIIDFETGASYTKINDTFVINTNTVPRSEVINRLQTSKFVPSTFLNMNSIEINDTISQGNYVGYTKECYSILPEVEEYFNSLEKCLKVPISILFDSNVYFRTGILESHEPNFSDVNTLKMWELKSIESIQVDSKFISDKLKNR